jgi:hypothetical protein
MAIVDVNTVLDPPAKVAEKVKDVRINEPAQRCFLLTVYRL